MIYQLFDLLLFAPDASFEDDPRTASKYIGSWSLSRLVRPYVIALSTLQIVASFDTDGDQWAGRDRADRWQ